MSLPNVVNMLGGGPLTSESGAEIPLNQPVPPSLSKVTEYLSGVHERAWFTNFGELHELFAERLSCYLGVNNLLLVNNGTTALQVAAKVLEGKTAVTTPYSFAATSSALDWINLDIQYCDIDPKSWNLSPHKVAQHLETHPEVDMLVPAHIYGNPCDIKKLEEVAVEFGVKTIYDAAQCFGVNYGSKSVMEHGDASAISFHATKLFHCIEGGAICFKHKQDYERARQMINFGFDGSELGPHGINGKLNEYQAAVGLALLDDIDIVLNHRKKLFNQYRNSLHGHFDLQQWSDESTENGGYFPIKLPSEKACQVLQSALKSNGIQSRIYFQAPLHEHYGNDASCPVAEELINRVLTLPLHVSLTEEQVDKICKIAVTHA